MSDIDETKKLFFEDEDEGIFADPERPVGAYGDEAAADDIRDEGYSPALQFGVAQDGLPVPVQMTPLPRGSAGVTWERFVCLAGPCRHYLELLQQYLPDAPEKQTRRFCLQLRSWAEPLDLAEADLWACSEYDPRPLTAVSPEVLTVAAALQQNRIRLLEVAERAEELGLDRGRCVDGPCRHVAELVLTYPATGTDEVRKVVRWCQLLAGARRPYEVHERPVYACSGWSPVARTSRVAQVAAENEFMLAQRRLQMAGQTRPAGGEPEAPQPAEPREDEDGEA